MLFRSGNGAFMKTTEDARALAKALVGISKTAGVKSVALLTDMSQPLGITIGNSLEIAESIAILKNRGPKDVHDLTVALAAQMLVLGGKAASLEIASGLAEDALRDGRALNAFKQLITAQGGDASVVDDPRKLPQAKYRIAVKAAESGIVDQIDTNALGLAAMQLGGGRAKKDDILDLAVGLVLHKKLGTPVTKGDTLVTLHADTENVDAISNMVRSAYHIGDKAPKKTPLIQEVIRP